MKKGKIIPMPTTKEAQIRARARNLPVGRCIVNSNWEEAQIVNVIVTRKHINGNVTFGFFLVDLMLLGVKDCIYDFNVSSKEFEEQLKRQDWEFMDCDYELAHNIVYEGVAFAEDYGFEPCREFTKTGIYILEEDSDDIPSIYIPLGDEGVPVVIIDPKNNRKREIAILEKTAGPDNFIVYNIDENGDIIDDDDDDDNFFDYYSDTIEEIHDIGFDEFLIKYEHNLDFTQTLAIFDIYYKTLISVPDTDKFKSLIELIFQDNRFEPDNEEIPKSEKHIDALQYILEKWENSHDAALAELETLVADNPDDIDLVSIKISMLRDMNSRQELEQLTNYWYDRVPNNHAIRLEYAKLLTEQERYDEIFELFDNQPGLNAITTDDIKLSGINVADFCACYVMAWLSKDNIEKAEPYYRILIMLNVISPLIMKVMMTMSEKKRNAIYEKGRDLGKIE